MEKTGESKTASEPQATDSPTLGKRVSVILTEEAFNELQRVSTQTRRSMTEIFRLGLGVVRLALDEQQRGNKLVIADNNNKPLREIVLPL